jgi:uroporphyrinogen decarboxylase
MTPRERVLRAMRREYPDKVPKEASFTPALYDRFKQETGSDNPTAYFDLEMRHVGFSGLRAEDFPDFTEYRRHFPANASPSGEYGTASVPAHYFHFWGYVFPLINATTVAEVERYPWPNVRLDYRHAHLEEQVARFHEQNRPVMGFAGHIFETSWQITGFEKMFEDMATNPAFVEAVLEHVTEDNCFRARRFAEAGVDILATGDDVGMKHGLMMHPQMWRKFLKPRLAREIAAARAIRPDIPVWYHSDGDISLIVDDLIEVGVTILNPVQPECLDVRWLKETYGDRLAFWGTIGTQSVMPFGSPNDVRRAVKEMIELFAPAVLIAPTHVLEPDVPWENVVAFFDAVEEYGRFA